MVQLLLDKSVPLREPNTSRILLVGASGRVGRIVFYHWQRLLSVGKIVPQYRQAETPGSLLWNPLEGSKPLLDAVAQGDGFDAIVMLAGVTPGIGHNLENNRILAQSILDAAQNAGITRVLLASSSAVYGLGNGSPFCEATPCSPVTAYGRAKLDMEQTCAPWRDKGVEVCCLRIGNVAGADALLQNVSRIAGAQSLEIDIFANGHGPLRSYIGPRTLASVLERLSLYDGFLPPVLNIAAPIPIYMEALANAAGQTWNGRAGRDQAYQDITLNCDALAKIYRFEKNDSDPVAMVRQWQDTR